MKERRKAKPMFSICLAGSPLTGSTHPEEQGEQPHQAPSLGPTFSTSASSWHSFEMYL